MFWLNIIMTWIFPVKYIRQIIQNLSYLPLLGVCQVLIGQKKRAKCIETSAEPTFAQDNVLPKLVSNGLTVG